MKVVIIGGGETGLALANLLGEDFTISIIEKKEAVSKDIANRTHALVIQGDGTDISILKEAGINEADAIVATTREDSTNLMICEMAQNEDVEKIITLVNNPKDDEIFSKPGITTVSVVGTNVTAIKKALLQKGSENIILQWGDIELIQQKVTKESPLVGKSPVISGAIVCGLSRGGEILIPTKDVEVEEGDVLLLSVKSKHVDSVLKVTQGK